MNMIQIGMLGIVGVLFATFLRQQKGEFSVALCIVISLVIFSQMISYLERIVEKLKEVSTGAWVDNAYMGTLLKMLGVTYVAEFASGICRDAGCQTIAGQIEIFCKLTLLTLSLPILAALLETIQTFLG